MSNDFDLSKGIDAAINALDQANKKVENSMLNKMEKGLATIELDAKRNCKTGSGELKASITHKKSVEGNEIIGVIGSPLEYAVYRHQGTGLFAINGDGRQDVPWVYRDPLTGKFYSTKGMKPNPFLQDAIDSNKGKLNDIFSESDFK